MNFYGINDPRIIHLAKALTLTGYNVLTPEIPEIKKILINQDTLKSISDFLELYESYIFNKNIGLFLISFSGGMTLIPLSNFKHKKFFKSILCVGAYSNFENSISYILKNFEHDNYGMYILLYNYIDLITKNQKIKNYFYDQIIFNSMGIHKIFEYLKIKNDLSKQESVFCSRIENDFNFRLEISDEIIKKKKDLIKKLSPINYIHNMDSESSINLIHGNNDQIISKQESIDMYQKLNNNKKSKLLISNLINHGDSISNIKNMIEIPSLISVFNNFFKNIGE
jgi:hypothetical protein